MSRELVVKRNKYGLRLVMDDQIPFEELLEQISRKFQETGSFFKDSQMGIAFEGRKLTFQEEQLIVKTIENNSFISIVCIIDDDKDLEDKMENRMEYNEENVEFFTRNLHSGQVLECKSNVTLIGDVNPGAKIIANGNIVILGSLKGKAYAGASGDRSCFVFALEMKPVQIQIGDVIAKSPDAQKKMKSFRRKIAAPKNPTPQIAFLREERICIAPAVKEYFQEVLNTPHE